NVGTAGGSLTVTLDTTAPSAPSTAIDLASASDSGSSNTDNITSALAPTVRVSLAGTNAVAGDLAELLLGGSALAHAVTATLSSTDISNGYVDLTVTSGDLGSDGTKALTARVTDKAGNVGTAGGAFSFTLDTTGPSAPSTAVDLASGSD
ncbi:Ig-like domain-containing protein, partial [Massilia sp. TS11]|uniref:Ig-like domain-containing protein n=1 Tax=Massilia sp. TS11 TaxID=2908003 RepID=UPI001EDC2351